MAPAHAKIIVEQTFLSAGGGTFQFRFGRLESRPNPAMRDWKACATAQIGTRPSILDYTAKTVAEDDSLQSPSPKFDVRRWMLNVRCFPTAFNSHCFPLTRASTTCGSARVDVSPIWSTAFSAILRKMRRMILPERVLGRPVAN